LIGLIGLDKKEADDYIMVLSRQYRNILDNKKSELLELDKEMESLSDLLYLLNIRYRQSLCLKNTFREAALAGFLVPGTLAFLAEEIIFNTIINENQPLDLAIDADGPDTLTMAYRPNPVLEGEHYNTGKMQMMNDTYHYFSGRDITKAESGGMIKYYIPILSLTDESSYH
jgi:two-component system LytT family sensor kinase